MSTGRLAKVLVMVKKTPLGAMMVSVDDTVRAPTRSTWIAAARTDSIARIG